MKSKWKCLCVRSAKFRDVLNIWDMYPGDPGNPGCEYAGVVARTGEDVTSVKVGDAIIGMGDGWLKLFVVSKDKLVHRKPENF